MSRPRLIWLSLPALVFVAVTAFFIAKMPKPQSSSTTITPNPTPFIFTPAQKSSPTSLQNLTQQIKDFNLTDPNLTAPSFDRSLEIPSD